MKELISFLGFVLKATKQAPVNPKSPLQELKPKTSESSWFFSNPIEAVASSISFALHLLFNSYKFFIGIFNPQLVSVEQANIQSYFSENFQEYSSAASKLQMIKSIGFSDAFIISTLNGKEISLENALELD